MIKQHDEVRKVSTGQGDDYTAGCLLDYAYFKDNHRLIAVDLSKQKALDADQKAIQQIVFQAVVGKDNNTKIRLSLFLKNQKKQSKNFTKEHQKFCRIYKWLNTIKQMLNYQIHN